MPKRDWREVVNKTLGRYYAKLNKTNATTELKHGINNHIHNKYYITQQHLHTNSQLDNLTSKYQIE